jgi:DNA modification methylase
VISPAYEYGSARLYHADCLDWLGECEASSIHAVVTDPPYGLVEYTSEELTKRENGSGGVWRIPPSFDGHQRAPLPRFTVLSRADHEALYEFFVTWSRALFPVLVPGAHVMVATNPLMVHMVAAALSKGGFEARGQIVRLVQTMRGGDRPKNAHEEFADVTVMPRSQHEPWVLFRRPLEGRVQDNLRQWGTGGLRRLSESRPFGDVIRSAPTHKRERSLAPHPSLKPQAFLREVVRSSLPLGRGVVLDPFAGSGSTLAAAEAVGYRSIGVERDAANIEMAQTAIPGLASLQVDVTEPGRDTGGLAVAS